MRTVSFVDSIEFEYRGNIYSKAVTVGDVDNDANNELVIGNIDGELNIFKGTGKIPWAKGVDLGRITTLQIGDVCNHGMNFLVTLTSEGWCNVFAIQYDHIPQDEESSMEEGKPILLKPSHKQHIMANNRSLIIADIDGDGLNELVIGYSDRQVRMYRWKEHGNQLPLVPGTLTGLFELIDIWHLAGQLGSVTVNNMADGTVNLMVSQPGGTFVTLYSKNTSCKVDTDVDQIKSDELSQSITSSNVIFHPLGSARARNSGVTTEIVATISRNKKGEETEEPNYSAICTLDGTLTLVDEDKILWSLYVDHQLFCLTKLDVTGDGREEVVACSWDGHTYLVNLSKEVVRFKFRENVAAFCAGYYSIDKNNNVPCLFYFTFNNRIVVYYKLNMLRIGSTTLLETMENKEGTNDILSYLNCDASKTEEVRQLYRWCLYGFNPDFS